MNNYNRVFCFKRWNEKKKKILYLQKKEGISKKKLSELLKDLDKHFVLWIKAEDCNHCYLYHRICHNLVKRPGKCFDPGNTLSEYEIERFYNFLEEIRRTLMLSTQEVLKFLVKNYNLEVDHSLIFKYAAKGLIKKGKKIGQGKSKGVQTFWEDSAPYKIYNIKQLLKKHGLKLEEIIKYINLVYNFNELEINKIYTIKYTSGYTLENRYEYIRNTEIPKFENVIISYACAEAKYRPGLEIRSINGKIFMPIFYSKVEENSIKELHIKILTIEELQNDKTLKDKKAYKEIIYSKEPVKIIG